MYDVIPAQCGRTSKISIDRSDCTCVPHFIQSVYLPLGTARSEEGLPLNSSNLFTDCSLLVPACLWRKLATYMQQYQICRSHGALVRKLWRSAATYASEERTASIFRVKTEMMHFSETLTITRCHTCNQNSTHSSFHKGNGVRDVMTNRVYPRSGVFWTNLLIFMKVVRNVSLPYLLGIKF